MVVTAIGEEAFNGCKNLRKVVIPKSIEKVGRRAFAGCSSLHTIYCESKGQPSGWDRNWNPLNIDVKWGYEGFHCDEETGFVYVEFRDRFFNKYLVIVDYKGIESNLIIPSSIVFKGEKVAVTTIGKEAFEGCDTLRTVVIPKSIERVGSRAFYRCSSLQAIYCESIEEPSGWNRNWKPYEIQVIWQFEGVRRVINGFDVAKCLDEHGHSYAIITGYSGYKSNLIIPSSIELDGKEVDVTEIGEEAFEGCDTLRNVVIPKSVKKIDKFAFDGCWSLHTIYCEFIEEPSGWNRNWNPLNIDVKWGYEGFHCDGETGFVYAEFRDRFSNKYLAIFDYKGTESNLIIPSSIVIKEEKVSVTTIGKEAFNGCHNLRTVVIPKSIEKVEDRAFAGCSSLHIIYCESSKQPSGWNKNWNSNDIYVVWQYFGEREVKNGFNVAICLDETEYLYAVITGYSGNKSNLVIPSSIELGGEEVDVTEIGEKAFDGCDTLRTVVIPKSIERVGSRAFYRCNSLHTIYCESIEEPSGWNRNWKPLNIDVKWGYEGFHIDRETGFVYEEFQDRFSNKYLAIVNYKGTESNLIIPSSIVMNGEEVDVTVIASRAFMNNRLLETVYIPKAIEFMEKDVFAGCNNSLKIYCEAVKRPNGWKDHWNADIINVRWGIKSF